MSTSLLIARSSGRLDGPAFHERRHRLSRCGDDTPAAFARISEIADHVAANSLVLFDESFPATNEREGSEIAKQIVCALLERRIKIFFVTHLYQ